MLHTNASHDPTLKSWLESANLENCEFPTQNLPFCVFKRSKTEEAFRAGIGIGDQILDCAAVTESECFNQSDMQSWMSCLNAPSLNAFMALGPSVWNQFRAAISSALAADSKYEKNLSNCLVAQTDAEYKLPIEIGDYTDFYTSIHHATNVGKLFRPDNPLLPNYKWIPIGYHGRSSSIDVSGQSFPRPWGQLKPPHESEPTLSPSKRLDYELEVGIYIGQSNRLGEPVQIDNAEDYAFGLCLLNDWSARDIQAWEYQPLGPFLSKSFASTVSPWVVTMEALAPYRAAWQRPAEDPQPLAYLDSEDLRGSGAVDMHLEVLIETAKMRGENDAPQRLAVSNFAHSYWSISQMIAHHSVNGCNLAIGDLFGSGTLSGDTDDSYGALLEATEGGKKPIDLANGEQRTFLEDGDRVILRGYCQHEEGPRIGFGEASGTVLPAVSSPC